MHALILAGGSGTRFWPLSRQRQPKQLLALEGETSLLQATVERLAPLIPPSQVWICTTVQLAAGVSAQVPAVPAAQILAEPQGRNTAPAVGWALGMMPEAVRSGTVAVLPADHRVADPAAFRRALAAAEQAVTAGDWVLTLGVTPRWPETGYGYLELGPLLEPATGLRQVVRFREKPDPQTAAAYVTGGQHWWNAGIFVFRGTTLSQHLNRFEPQIAAGLAAIAADPARTAELYAELPNVSIDYGVMERLETIAALPLDCGWSDLGSWEALHEILPRDSTGNCQHGAVIALDAEANLLWAEQGTIAALGISGLVVVKTGDAVLVLPRERAQEVRRLIAELERQGRGDLL